ncbi:hypothetical protein BDQ17DRAFT_1183294, partial [Cyathus striatus]
GPALPCHDHDASHECHARLMLIFFFPWRSVHDLHQQFHSWLQAFNHFHANCSEQICEIISNMQILHECKDSRDD